MIRATQVLAAGSWSNPAVDTAVLDFDQRHRRRIAMTGAGGLSFLLDLTGAVPLRNGDGLLLEDGRVVGVVAAPEPLAVVTTRSPDDLLRVAWHIGNRHLPAQFLGKCIRIRRDHVIEMMVAGLGATVTLIEAPFDPESGAYHGGHHHHAHDNHSHTPEHEHDDRLDE